MGPIVPPADGSWVDAWVSPPRLARYLSTAGGDRGRAVALYEWNTQVGAALQRDLAHLEVALRNRYDAAGAAAWSGSGHWLRDGYTTIFAPAFRAGRTPSGGRVDVHAKSRKLVERAIRAAGGAAAPPGKVVAELSFGFWRYLSSSRNEKPLWVPYLHKAFRAGTARTYVDSRAAELHGLRNRVAHHEHLLGVDLPARMSDLFELAEVLYPELAAHLRATSTVPGLAAARP